jgi:hypothetical protein
METPSRRLITIGKRGEDIACRALIWPVGEPADCERFRHATARVAVGILLAAQRASRSENAAPSRCRGRGEMRTWLLVGRKKPSEAARATERLIAPIGTTG